MTKDFAVEDGRVVGINTTRVEWTKGVGGGWEMKTKEGSEEYFPADLVLLSMGFLGPDDRLFNSEVELDARKNIKTPKNMYNTNLPGVFAAGDCRRGQSLIVWGINEGRQCARQVDSFLMGTGSALPVTGGIVRRAQHDTVPAPRKMKAGKGGGDLAHTSEEYKRNTDAASA
jgi:glutamate synthase (NADPH/NADH)